MANSKKPRKKHEKNTNIKRLLGMKFKTLPIEFRVMCQPLDTFFSDVLETGQVTEINGKAVMDDPFFERAWGIRTSGVGFVDSLAFLVGDQSLAEKHLMPLRTMFSEIDSGKDFSAQELQSAYDGWQWTKRLISETRIGDFIAALQKYEEKNESQRHIS